MVGVRSLDQQTGLRHALGCRAERVFSDNPHAQHALVDQLY
jgi:hypothetical protein